jgi:hypothetical protein
MIQHQLSTYFWEDVGLDFGELPVHWNQLTYYLSSRQTFLAKCCWTL